jgi:hypothetical protein
MLSLQILTKRKNFMILFGHQLLCNLLFLVGDMLIGIDEEVLVVVEGGIESLISRIIGVEGSQVFLLESTSLIFDFFLIFIFSL